MVSAISEPLPKTTQGRTQTKDSPGIEPGPRVRRQDSTDHAKATTNPNKTYPHKIHTTINGVQRGKDFLNNFCY